MVIGGSNVDGSGWKCVCEFTKCHRLFGWMSRVIQKHLLKMRHPSLYKTKCLWAFSALVKTIVPRRQHHRSNVRSNVNMRSVLAIGIMYIFNVSNLMYILLMSGLIGMRLKYMQTFNVKCKLLKTTEKCTNVIFCFGLDLWPWIICWFLVHVHFIKSQNKCFMQFVCEMLQSELVYMIF